MATIVIGGLCQAGGVGVGMWTKTKTDHRVCEEYISGFQNRYKLATLWRSLWAALHSFCVQGVSEF